MAANGSDGPRTDIERQLEGCANVFGLSAFPRPEVVEVEISGDPLTTIERRLDELTLDFAAVANVLWHLRTEMLSLGWEHWRSKFWEGCVEIDRRGREFHEAIIEWRKTGQPVVFDACDRLIGLARLFTRLLVKYGSKRNFFPSTPAEFELLETSEIRHYETYAIGAMMELRALVSLIPPSGNSADATKPFTADHASSSVTGQTASIEANVRLEGKPTTEGQVVESDESATTQSGEAVRPEAVNTRTSSECEPSDDYTRVSWGKQEFEFLTVNQSNVVRHLFEAQKANNLPMFESTLCDRAGISGKIRDTFRFTKGPDKGKKHPALGVMIIKAGKQAWTLAVPPFDSAQQNHGEVRG